MASLRDFDPYTSYRLHWYPYEITRCMNLVDSRVSLRSLYGNIKDPLRFPPLDECDDFAPLLRPADCSVCRVPLEGEVHRRWISLRVATDTLPLLVHACSLACIEALPATSERYPADPHLGG